MLSCEDISIDDAILTIPARPADQEVEIVSMLRKMKGGSQAHLIRATDNHFYVAKFRGNPQGNRTLINEWVVSYLLQQLEILTPELRPLRLSEETAEDPALYFSVGSRRESIVPGVHLGSTCPVNPEQTAIFDFLPSTLLDRVSNLNQFGSMFVVDRWLGQVDYRQSIFARSRKRSSELRFDVWFVDHGLCLGGCRWEFQDSHLFGLPLLQKLYQRLPMKAICNAAIEQIVGLSESAILNVSQQVPQEWFQSRDEQAMLHRLLKQVCKRRGSLADLVHQHLRLLSLV